MKQKLAILAGLSGLLLAVSYFLTETPKPDATDKIRVSGALRSLGFWNDQRAYPNKSIPSTGYYAAFESSRKLFKGGADQQTDPWEAIGPHNVGGRTLAVALNPQNPNTIYAGSASGGLWRSRSGGAGVKAWESIRTGFPVLAVSTIAIAPDDSNTIYIGTGEVYNYQNAGTGFAIRPTRGSYGIGILKSTDGGATWTKSLDWTSNQERGVWAVKIDTQNSNMVWAGTTEGVFKSSNAGLNWEQVNSTIMIMDLVIHPTNTNTVFAAAGNLGSVGRGIFRTQNGGESWEKLQGLPQNFGGKAMLAVSPSSPNVVYASIGNGTSFTNGATWLAKSENNGDTWSIISQLDYSLWQGWFAHDIAVHPSDPNTIIPIGVDIWRSTDGGVNLDHESDWGLWRFGKVPIGGPEGANGNYSHADHHDVVYHPTDPDIVYFATDGGVFRSLDGGKTFEGCNGGYQTTQFYQGFACSENNPNLCIGGLQDNSTVIYDGTFTWSREIGGDGGFAAIDPSNENILYGSWQGLNINQSLDAGRTWTNIAPPNQGVTGFIAPFVVSPSQPGTLYAGRSFVFKSTNTGASWATMNQGQELDGNPLLAMAVSYQTSSRLYVTTAPFGSRGGVFRTLNGGASFTNITGTLPDRYPVDITVDPNNDEIVYVVLSGFGTSHVFKSTDAGDAWLDIGLGLPDVPTSAIIVDPVLPDHIYLGNDLGVYVSLDGGLSWQQFLTGLPDAVIAMDLTVSPANRKLRMATHGNGAYQRDLVGTATSVEGPTSVISDFRLAQNYPNPFNPSTTIEYELPRDSKVTLKIYNVLGEEIITLINQRQTRGAKSAVWDGKTNSGQSAGSGVYVYTITADNFRAARRMILLK